MLGKGVDMSQREVLHLLGVTTADIQACLDAPNHVVAQQQLERMRDRARRNYDRIAPVLFMQNRANDLRELTETMEYLESVSFRLPVPASFQRVA
jgi:uncharacterized protein (DUF1499 family)